MEPGAEEGSPVVGDSFRAVGQGVGGAAVGHGESQGRSFVSLGQGESWDCNSPSSGQGESGEGLEERSSPDVRTVWSDGPSLDCVWA